MKTAKRIHCTAGMNILSYINQRLFPNSFLSTFSQRVYRPCKHVELRRPKRGILQNFKIGWWKGNNETKAFKTSVAKIGKVKWSLDCCEATVYYTQRRYILNKT